MEENKKLNILDAMSIVSFMIGVANYEENITQSDLQGIMKQALSDIHRHLEKQDDKIDDILRILKEATTK